MKIGGELSTAHPYFHLICCAEPRYRADGGLLSTPLLYGLSIILKNT